MRFPARFGGRTQEIKLLWQHQPEEPIGVISRIFEDARGLYVEGALLLHVQRAREALALMKAGVLSGLSIGYSPLRYSLDESTGARRLKAVELWEVSLVTFPANAHAKVTVVKSASAVAEKSLPPAVLLPLSEAVSRATQVLRINFN